MVNNNIRMIETVAKGLNEKLPEVVFVGGSVMEFYVDDKAISSPRGTDDVDIVVEVATRASYDNFEEELRNMGFINDVSGPACRMIYNEVKVDIITTIQSAGGFTNKWYVEGFEKSVTVKAGSTEINIFRVEYYIASKLEAFKGRGEGNLITSRDFEDIVYVFDGRKDISDDLLAAGGDVKEYLKKELSALIGNSDIEEALNAHVGFAGTVGRADRILEIFKVISR